ncbi:MAG: photosystem II reaction center protein PsbZ [Agrobacterium sp.]|uniref:Photosystem II reaction center protein Z n=1 Tax=Haematococcus lacustris TaxID=44745 RepID=A0A0S2IDJ6_HAELA|nr:photosystem II reaction center protein Z [Haematococcus lacustris]ALO21568.1 Z protein of photosystem II [Haematococcus lacustris]AUW36502.1 photosystem II reaction center protein Z [Haematococcus lacustris]
MSLKFYFKNQKKFIDINMTSILQVSLLALILVSFALVVGVPVVFASPNGWTENKGVVFSGLSLWFLLVFAVGIFNSFVV